jgi:hypothetical protein
MESIKSADLVLASATLIQKDLRQYRDDVLLIENAVEPSDFEKVTDFDPELQLVLKKITNGYAKVIGYYGAIAEWMDFELLAYCAIKNPEYLFLLVGKTYPGIKIPKMRNLISLNRISYRFLSQLLEFINVCMIPFKKNDITIHTSPVKMFEYLAAGKPVVSTDLPEVTKYSNVVYTAGTKEEFEKQLHEAIKREGDIVYQRMAKDVAVENSWGQRVRQVLHVLADKKGVF